MNRTFFIFICGCLMYAAMVQAQAQDGINARYYREIQIDAHDGKYGLLYHDKAIVPYVYDTIVAQKDNRVFITQKDGKYGITGLRIYYGDKKDGKKMFPYRNQKLYFFEKEGSGNRAKGIHICVEENPCEYNEIKFIDGRYWVSKGNQKGILNSDGDIILRCEYNEIEFIDGRYWVSKGNQKGILNSEGDIILRCEYEEIKFIDGRYWVSKNNRKGILNSDGDIILY